MKQVRLKGLILPILMISVTAFAACTSDTANFGDEKKQLGEISQVLGVVFPAEARIIHASKNDRSNELAYFYIIYTPLPVKFDKLPIAKITAEDSTKFLKKKAGNRKIGKLADKWKYCYEGKMKNGEWSAYQTNFENGSYLEVEQFYF